MTRSRRDFLNSVGIGIAAGAGLHWPSQSPWSAQSDEFIHLDSNENAYGPSAKVAVAIRSAAGTVNRYPFRKYAEITERIAAFHRVQPEQVLFACGSTEILRIAACAFLGRERQLVQARPTFEAIQNYANSVRSEVVSVLLGKGFSHDLDGMLARVGPSTGLVYICNPNNPTATITPRQDLVSFIGKLPATVKVLIDEAYHHYVGESGVYGSFIDHPLNDDRLIVTRTFSKVYGLAGLRLGYAVASPNVIEKMRTFLTEDSLNSIIAEVIGVALEDIDGVRDFVKRNADDRQEFFNSSMVRRLKPVQSSANFVMMDVQHPVEEVIEHFRNQKILIGRHFPPLDTYIRVSFGMPDEMRAFWRAWDLLPWSKTLMMQH